MTVDLAKRLKELIGCQDLVLARQQFDASVAAAASSPGAADGLGYPTPAGNTQPRATEIVQTLLRDAYDDNQRFDGRERLFLQTLVRRMPLDAPLRCMVDDALAAHQAGRDDELVRRVRSLPRDNLGLQVLDIEAMCWPHDKVVLARKQYLLVASEILDELEKPEHAGKALEDQAVVAYEVLLTRYRYALQGQVTGGLLPGSAGLDCDTTSLVIASVLHERQRGNPSLRGEVGILEAPGHTWLRVNGVNLDFGVRRPDKYYLTQFSLPSDFFERALPISPIAIALRLRAETLLSSGGSKKRDQARRDLEQVGELDAQSLLARDDMARLLKAEGRLDEAMRVVTDGLEIAPRDALLLVRRGSCLASMGLLPQAMEAYRQAQASGVDLGLVLSLVGGMHKRLEQPEQAIEAYRQAIVYDGQDAFSIRMLGHLYVSLGRLDEARSMLTLLEKVADKSAYVYCKIGDLYGALGHKDKAIEAYEAGLRVDARDISCLANLARYQASAGRPDESRALIGRLARADTQSSTVQVYLGQRWLELKELAKAHKAFCRAIALDSRNAEAFRQRAFLLLHMGKHEQAREDITRYESINGIHEDTYVTLGGFYEQAHESDKALAAYEQAHRINDRSVEAHRLHGLLLAKLTRRDEALVQVRKLAALTHYPNALDARGSTPRNISSAQTDILDALGADKDVRF